MGAKNNFTTNRTVTITLASLANNTFATSSVIDNSSDLFVNADIQIKFRTTTVSTGAQMPTVGLFLVRSADGGLTFDDSTMNATLLDVYTADTDNTTFIYSTDTAQTCPQLPEFFKIVVLNKTGNPFDAVVGNFSVVMTGKKNVATANFV